jgi:hypothetical protein
VCSGVTGVAGPPCPCYQDSALRPHVLKVFAPGFLLGSLQLALQSCTICELARDGAFVWTRILDYLTRIVGNYGKICVASYELDS